MQLLEQELGVKLIERTGRKIKLTNSGETFLKYANEIIDLVNEGKEVIRNESIPKGTLRLGLLSHFVQLGYLRYLKRIMKDIRMLILN